MGIHLLASALATLAAFNIQASTLPQMPPLKVADLTLPISAVATESLIPAAKQRLNSDRQAAGSDYWLDEKQPLTYPQRWVF